jgi:PIN domain nuclease of toxin-antitoxin system
MVVLDTCAIIELCSVRPRLSKSVLAEVDREAHIVSVSFAEISLKVKQKKLTLSRTPEELFAAMRAVSSISIIPVDVPEWFQSIALKWSHRDPADRLIVAYAKARGASIVTSDQEMKRFYRRCIWS